MSMMLFIAMWVRTIDYKLSGTFFIEHVCMCGE